MPRRKPVPYVDFTFEDNKYELMGIYFPNGNTIKIYLSLIRTPDELFNTIEHEALHKAMDDIDFIDEEEHWLIDKMFWADYNL